MELNKIINAESIEYMKNNIASRSFDYGFTSPPYNRKRNDKYQEYNDIIPDYFQFLCDFTNELLRVSKIGVFINIQSTMYNKIDVNKFIGKYADKIQNIFIWVKTNPMPASGNNITNSFEYFFYLSDKPLKSNFTYTKNVVITSVNSSMPKEHKAVMKEEVCDYFMENFMRGGESVIDCFGGIGTTAVCARKRNIDYLLIEKEELYCNMANERLNTTLF